MGDCAVTNCNMPATRLLEVSGEGLSFDGGKIHVPNASMEIGAYVCDSHELKDTPGALGRSPCGRKHSVKSPDNRKVNT